MTKRRTELTLITLSVILLAMGSVGCGHNRPAAVPNTKSSTVSDSSKTTKMKIKIGDKVFDATLFDNPTAGAFKVLLPLTLEMEELNGNEKKYDFPKDLPTNASNPKTINNGDLMIWGSKTLVLFYKTFPTSYSYTKLGRIDDPKKLEAAVGKGDVRITFELADSVENTKQ